MVNKFSTFEELVNERRRLEADVAKQKSFIRSEILEIRDRLTPITKVLSFFARFGHSDNSIAGNLLKLGSNVGVDLLVGQKLKKAGWLARLVLPFIMKFTARKSIDAVRK